MSMISSLFSSFDPLINISAVRYSPLILMYLILIIFLNKSRLNETILLTWNFLNSEIKISSPRPFTKGKTKILFTLFLLILLLNLRGLFPHTYTLTAQIIFTLSLAFPLWISMVLFSIHKNTNHFLRHLVPLGTPIALSQFMTLIETVSQIIRPITLSVRLAANITAGHILIALSRSPIIIINHFRLVLVILFMLEIAVAFIQAYVFITLLSIYLRETYDTIPPLSYSLHKTLTLNYRDNNSKFIYENHFLN